MALLYTSSPHTHKPISTSRLMLNVVWATIPGTIALTYFFGFGTLINLALAIVIAIAAEALVLKLRNRPVSFFIKDNSALVTGLLLALAIPPSAPWWLVLIGVSFSVIIAKQLYGGLGSNPFNPAMIGYVLLLISFPQEMTSWLPAKGVAGATPIGLLDALQLTFTGNINGQSVDALTAATPLDTFKTYSGNIEYLAQSATLNGLFAGAGWEWVNLAFLLGGLYLIARKIITWHIPVAMLLTLLLISGLNYGIDTDAYGSPLFHLFSGGTMLGAFFIATDPVTAATSNKGKLIYGAGIGLLVYIIRTWGGYPDAIAFSVLLMNLAAPTIDYYSQPRTYGHNKANRGIATKK